MKLHQECLAAIDRFHEVSRTLLRGAQPETTADFERLKALGVKTIVNLRTTPILLGPR